MDWRWRDGLSRKGCSSMNIPWEFTLNCFWFVYFFQYSALTHTPSVPALTPRAPTHPPSTTTNTTTHPLPLMPPSPHHPPRFHKWCSDVHQTRAMKDHYKLLGARQQKSTPTLYPHLPSLKPPRSEISDVKDQMNFQNRGAPIEPYLLPMQMGSKKKIQESWGEKKKAHCSRCVWTPFTPGLRSGIKLDPGGRTWQFKVFSSSRNHVKSVCADLDVCFCNITDESTHPPTSDGPAFPRWSFLLCYTFSAPLFWPDL